MSNVLRILIYASTAFLSLYVLSRLLGKKQIAQLNFVDYVIGISLGSIAAEMASDLSELPFYYYIIAMLVFFVLDLSFNFISKKGWLLKKLLNGKPTVIVYQGKVDYHALKKGGIDINDMLSLLREAGYFDIKQVKYALLELSGKISVLPTGQHRPTVAADLPITIQETELPNYLVIDGAISQSGLRTLDRDEQWLYDKLKITEKKQLKNIILAVYSPETQTVIAHRKT